MRTWFVGLLAIVIGILLAPSAFAQNAQITGSVKDSSGASLGDVTGKAAYTDTAPNGRDCPPVCKNATISQ